MSCIEELGAFLDQVFKHTYFLKLGYLSMGLDVVDHGEASLEVNYFKVLLGNLIRKLIDVIEFTFSV